MTQVGRVRDAELDGVFHALAKAPRRRILDVVAASPGCGVNQVAEHFEMSRIGVLKHVNLLEEAGLPAGVLNLVHGQGRTAGRALTAHPDIQLMSCTGSTHTGRAVAEMCARGGRRSRARPRRRDISTRIWTWLRRLPPGWRG